MLNTTLSALTQAQGAQYSTYSGWEMPSHYGDPEAEYRTAHSAAVLRDASHLSRILISGVDHLDFLQRMTTNDFHNLHPGTGLEAVFPDNRGRIVELGTFYRSGTATLAVLGPSSRETLPAWLDRYIFTEEIELEDITLNTALIELTGPRAAEITVAVLGKDLSTVENHDLLNDPTRDGIWLVRLDRSGYPGLRLAGTAEEVQGMWEKLQAHGARPAGEEVFEILRIEAGLPASSRELTEDHNPWEAGLGHAINMNKGCYIGQEVIARLDTYDKVKQHLVGLKLPEGPLPSPGTTLTVEEREVGRITSVTCSPRIERNIALAYVRRVHCDPGTQVQIRLNGTGCEAEVVGLPFEPET